MPKLFHSMFLGALLTITIFGRNVAVATAAEMTPETTAELETLQQNTPNFFAHINTITGKPDFLFGKPLFTAQEPTTDYAVIIDQLFKQYPNVFPVAITEFELIMEQIPDRSMSQVHLYQHVGGVASMLEMVFIFNQDRELIAIVGGQLPPSQDPSQPEVDITPQVSANEAKQVAVTAEQGDANTTEPKLLLLNKELFTGKPASQTLVWQLKANGTTYLINANTKEIVHKLSGTKALLNRSIYTAGGETPDLPGTLLISEGDDYSAITELEAVQAYLQAQNVYDYYQTNFDLDSIDGSGHQLISTVSYGANIGAFYCVAVETNPICPKLSQVIFQTGFVTPDIVAHEWTHGVIAHAIYNATVPIGLMPLGESGSLTESYADIFGVLIEAQYGAGLDWEMGEDSAVGVVRSLESPADHNQPERMADKCTHETQDQPNCKNIFDIHINAGIPNKAAYLLMREPNEGEEVFDGVAVQGIGTSKAQQIFYYTVRDALMHFPTFSDNLHALLATCFTLDKADITMQDCQSVYNAYAAVGIADGTLITNTDFIVQPAKVEADPTV